MKNRIFSAIFTLLILSGFTAKAQEGEHLPVSITIGAGNYYISSNGYEWVVEVSCLYIIDDRGDEMASGAPGYQIDWYSNGSVGSGPLTLSISNGPWSVGYDGSLPGNDGVKEYDVQVVYRNPSTGHSISSNVVHLQYNGQ